jgi:hypothetical protein
MADERPSMQQSDHPDHNMPDPEHDGLVQDMYYQKAVDDRKEVDSGTRFYDTGTRIPGAQKAKNDNWVAGVNERARRSQPSKD